MTGGPHEPALHLFADLRLDVDGVQAQVSGDGPELIVATAHPLRLVRAALRGTSASGASPRTVAAQAGERLASHGVSVSLAGPQGRLATVGASADSRVGALVAGTRRVSLDTASAARPALALAGVAAAVILIRRSRRPN